MAITINGNGTVTGISVGGLPNGIVDTDMIAAGAVTAPKRGSGAILQVEQNSDTSTTGVITLTSASDWYDLTNMNVAITPASTSNKILLSVSMMGEGDTADHTFRVRIKRAISGGATTYIAGGGAGSRIPCIGTVQPGYFGDNQDSTGTMFGISNYRDNPATTSTVTYTIQMNCQNANVTWAFNRCITDSDTVGYERGISWITAMELAA